jgi:coenzyme Q-binding protein COQ10
VANHRERRRLPYAPDKVYAIVADVERYPEFIPWVEGLRVLSRTPTEDGGETIRAEMAVRFKVFRERFLTEVDLAPDAPEITVRYLQGPFRRLENRWKFLTEAGGAETTVDFWIEYEFKRGPLQLLARTFQSEAVFRLVRAFVARAHALYGPKVQAKS